MTISATPRGRGRRPAALALVLAALLAPKGVSAQSPEPDLARLEHDLAERIARHAGQVHLSLLDPRTGTELLAIRGDEPVPSASMIKVPLLVELFHQVENGELRLDDPLVMLEVDRQPGSGVLQLLEAPHHLTVREAAALMIAFSDNTATNLLIDEIGIRSVWDRMEALGLPRTKLHSKTFLRATSVAMDSSRVYGLGVTTASEFARLLGMIYRGETVSPEASAQMVELLEDQHYVEGIPRALPGNVTVAHKTGALSASRHDCGIVYSEARDYVLCILTNENEDRGWRLDAEPYLVIRDLAAIVHRHMTGGGG